MREILFRGKRVDNGEWVEGYYATIGEYHYILTGQLELVPYLGFEHFFVNPDTIGQFTGLTDENGVKIFEGISSDMAIQYIVWYLSKGTAQLISDWCMQLAKHCRSDITRTLNRLRLSATSTTTRNCWRWRNETNDKAAFLQARLPVVQEDPELFRAERRTHLPGLPKVRESQGQYVSGGTLNERKRIPLAVQ